MAKTAAAYYEVRWRLKDSDEAWSAPQRVNPANEIVVEGLDRTKAYEFEARAVSSCGAKSDWVSGDHTVPGAPAGTLTLPQIKDEVDDAAAAAAQANIDLANIASDNLLTAGEKPIVIRDYNVILTEQAGIDAQATSYGITTEKTTYDSKVTNLVNYLNTLASPTDWNDLGGNTTIVGATFRQAFADVYTTRQALLNAIYAAAKARAAAAQSTADTAQSLASQVAVLNPGFDAGDTGWTKESGWSIKSDGSFGNGPGYAQHDPISGDPDSTDAAIRNNAVCLVETGHSYKVQALIQASGANGGCGARISWRNLSDSEVGYVEGNRITGTTTAGSVAVGPAPAGAVYAHAEVAVYDHTAGTYKIDNVVSTLQPATVDEIGDGATYARTQAFMLQNGVVIPYGNGDNLVPNHSFAANDAGITANVVRYSGSNVCDGWVTGNSNSDDYMYAMYEGSATRVLARLQQGVTIPANSNASISVYGTRKIPVTSGETLYAAATLRRDANQSYPASVTLTIFAGLHFYDASGNILSNVGVTADKTLTTQTVKFATINVPSNAAYAVPLLLVIHTTSGTAFNTSAGLYADVRFVDLQVVRQIALEQPGSGRRLGDLRNQVMAGVGNFASGWSGGSITYSASSTSATISAGSATLVIGSQSLAYNASSTTVSGSAGLTRTYYLYYDDDNYTGGSKTLHATTSQITALSADGRVYVGQVSVTFPTSGTGSGGGGQGCPDENAWVLRADPEGVQPDWCVRAKNIEVGHYLRLSDGRAGQVTYSQRKLSPRVRVVDTEGHVLTCSPSAPLELAGEPGRCLPAPDTECKLVLARFRGDPCWAALIDDVEDVGDGYVQHITCENACFWTGDDPEHLFSHHNMKPLPTG